MMVNLSFKAVAPWLGVGFGCQSGVGGDVYSWVTGNMKLQDFCLASQRSMLNLQWVHFDVHMRAS